ncbi:fungal-specific transcription factor domain-containing protein [Coniochaeta sp. 2T2.1]|nr:fungal-specific transcription factor domain-containing protein [Coniochaeta sp. 2T2.1]
METQQPDSSPWRGAGYKRASRKGAPRRFTCDFAGCDKMYSRAEHLQRHQLNHEPKEIFRCDVGGCDQRFVRSDLLARHRKRHTTSYIPRNRAPSFSSPPKDTSPLASATGMISPSSMSQSRVTYTRVPHDAAILLTSESSAEQGQSLAITASSSRMPQPPSWPAAIPHMSAAVHPASHTQGYYQRHPQTLPDQQLAFSGVQFAPVDMTRASTENFGTWLFDPCNGDFSVAQLPFLDCGLESTFNSNIHYDYESGSLTSSRSQLETPPRQTESDELLHHSRRLEILNWFELFKKNPRSKQLASNLLRDSNSEYPGLSLDNLRECVREYWQYVASRLPIVHQPTFNCNRGSPYLLMIMIALGAASLRGHDTTGQYSDCSTLAEVLIDSIRWEIATQEDASPPVSLSVAQSLLLLELYEKMYSSRRFHERAHIYHTSTLTLLRRGSPLIGRCGTETPPEEHSTTDSAQGANADARAHWIQWADTEAMHRVVFAAFMMDILHAAMFGHAADMAPHEIRLPLPCDDALWTAPTPELARQHESNLRMYGIKTGVPFLDGLKKALHGKEVPTASFGRMIIMSGLLSENWKAILLKAFDNWKTCFDAAQGNEGSPSFADQGSQRTGLNGPIQSASVLYHLAHISLHVDIVDCQVYAGAKRVLGRKVSARDRANVVSRMESWAHLLSTRHAVLHAFKLLHRVLVDPRRSSSNSSTDRERIKHEPHASPSGFSLPPIVETRTYSCCNEPDPHRPWIMYYAALSIWSYVMALRKTHKGHYDGHALSESATSRHPHHGHQPAYSAAASSGHWPPRQPPGNYGRVAAYLSDVAGLKELEESAAGRLADGLPDLLDVLHSVLSEAQSELLREAHDRLRAYKDLLLSAPG